MIFYETVVRVYKYKYMKTGVQGGAIDLPSEETGTKDGNEGNEEPSLDAQLRGSIVQEKPNVQWEEVVGLENAKQALLQAVIYPIRFPQLFRGARRPWSGILLYGPPGTGKSFLAKAVATKVDGTFFSVSSADLTSKWVGESAKLVRTMFQMAREAVERDPENRNRVRKPSIIFVDEIDALVAARGEGENESSRRIKTEFLTQLQGVNNDNTGVLFMAATNMPWVIDPAMRRRFDKRIFVDLPRDINSRKHMIKVNLKNELNTLSDLELDKIARQLKGYSPSDISNVVKEALLQPVSELEQARYFCKVEGLGYMACGRDGPNLVKFCTNDQTGQRMLCKQGDTPVELEIGLIDLPVEVGYEVYPRPVSYNDFEVALRKQGSTVDTRTQAQFREWTAEFGENA